MNKSFRGFFLPSPNSLHCKIDIKHNSHQQFSTCKVSVHKSFSDYGWQTKEAADEKLGKCLECGSLWSDPNQINFSVNKMCCYKTLF